MGTWLWDLLAPHRPPKPPAPIPPEPPPDPPPSARRVIRVTDDQDGEIINRGYAYWSQAWVHDGTVTAFAGHASGRTRFFRVDIASGAVERLGPLVPYIGTAEGWYWDHDGWIYLCEGPRLRRVNPFTSDDHVVFDISDTHPGCRLWQAHSSDDGVIHSATVERIVDDGPYQRLGTIVKRNGGVDYFPAQGALDESQITPDGSFLIIKEDHDNRIITLAIGEERRITDAQGAVGHSDCGLGVLVGEDNQIGACVAWDLHSLTKRKLFDTWNMGYVSVRGGRCLHSGETELSLVALDGSGVTPLVEHGGTGGNYDSRVKANIDPSGHWACWVADPHGRMDLFLMELP